jgi:hypothetical protein
VAPTPWGGTCRGACKAASWRFVSKARISAKQRRFASAAHDRTAGAVRARYAHRAIRRTWKRRLSRPWNLRMAGHRGVGVGRDGASVGDPTEQVWRRAAAQAAAVVTGVKVRGQSRSDKSHDAAEDGALGLGRSRLWRKDIGRCHESRERRLEVRAELARCVQLQGRQQLLKTGRDGERESARRGALLYRSGGSWGPSFVT